MIENCKLNRRGSILITVLVIGTILISAYFFFATRQLAKAKAQSETMEYRNQKAYLESYIDYLTEHPQVMSNQEFDNGAIIVDFLSNNADIIIGSLDMGGVATYDISGDKKIMLEWNKCSDNYSTDLMLVDGAIEKVQKHILPPPPSTCNMNPDDYDDRTESSPTPVSIANNSFTLKTINAPFYYRITPLGNTQLIDNQWHLKAHLVTDDNKTITVEQTFTAP